MNIYFSGLFVALLMAGSPLIASADVIADLTSALAAPTSAQAVVTVPQATAAPDRTALIAQLQQLVAQLTKQLADLVAQKAAQATVPTSTDTSPNTSTSEPAGPVLSRALSYGSRGDDVTSLQRFLIQEGLLAQDSATGFFGRATEKAVQVWQSKRGIVSSGSPAETGWGVVGKRTREALRVTTPSAVGAQIDGLPVGDSMPPISGGGGSGALAGGSSGSAGSSSGPGSISIPEGTWSVGGLSWKRGNLHNSSAPFLHAYSLSKPAEITDTLTSAHALDTGRSVTIGFDKNGGGYAASAKITGFASVPSSFETTVMGYGRGLLGAIRDRMHSNMYNPEQAGRTDHIGAVTQVVSIPGSVTVPQFQAPLYQDGGDGTPSFPFSAEKSEFDFSAINTDVASRYGIPSVEHAEYWAWARAPEAITQFLSGKTDTGSDIYQPKQLIRDTSPDPAKKVTPAATDMSFLVYVLGGTRIDASFRYIHYRAGGSWHVVELEAAEQASGDKGVIWDCRYVVPNADAFVFDTTGAKVSLTPASTCALDLPLVVISNSVDQDADTGVGLYVPQDELNTQQMHIVNSKTGVVMSREDRRFAIQFDIGGVLKQSNYATGPFRFLNARQYLSGMESPDTAAKVYGADATEILTGKNVFLYGTPNEILNAVQGGQPAQPKTASLVAPAFATAGYDIIVVAGQSNSVGQGTGQFSDPDASASIDSQIVQLSRSGNGITSANGGSACASVDSVVLPVGKVISGVTYDGLQHWGAHCRTASLGFGLSFARKYVREQLQPGRKVLIVPAGYGGTSVMQWQSGADKVDPGNTFNLYQDMKKRIQAALAQPGDNRVVAFLWSQGESDALSMSGNNIGKYPGMTQSQFSTNLENVFAALRADVPSLQPFPIITTRLAPNWNQWFTCNTDGTVRRYIDITNGKRLAEDAIQSVANEARFAPAGVVDPSGLGNESDVCSQTIAGTSANPHLNAAAQVELGKRFFQAWVDANVPKDRACTFNGQTIASGSSVTAWQAASVPAAQSCVSELRTCTNGTLSGTYGYASCSVSNQEPAGSFFSINSTGILSGYAYDLDMPSQSVKLSIYRDGPRGSGTLVDSFTTPVQRDDINARYALTGLHGFSWQISAGDIGASHSWYVYADDANKPGIATLLSGSPKTFPGAATCTLTAPASASTGQQITVSWTSTGAAKATLAQANTGLSQTITDLASGSATVTAPSATGNFILTVIDDANVYGRCTARVVIK